MLKQYYELSNKLQLIRDTVVGILDAWAENQPPADYNYYVGDEWFHCSWADDDDMEFIRVQIEDVLRLNVGDRARVLWSAKPQFIGQEGTIGDDGDQYLQWDGDYEYIQQGETDILEKL